MVREVPPHSVSLPKGRENARNTLGENSGVPSPLGEKGRMRGSLLPPFAPLLNMAEHGFDQNLSLRPGIERVRRYLKGKPPKFAPAEDARHGLASEPPCREACDSRGLIGGNSGVTVQDQAVGVAPACFRHQYPRVELRAAKSGLLKKAAKLADGAA